VKQRVSWIVTGEQSLYLNTGRYDVSGSSYVGEKTLTDALRLESTGEPLTLTGLVFVVDDSAAELPIRE